MFDVHPKTIRRWVREDNLCTSKLPGCNYNRFTPQELNRLRQRWDWPP